MITGPRAVAWWGRLMNFYLFARTFRSAVAVSWRVNFETSLTICERAGSRRPTQLGCVKPSWPERARNNFRCPASKSEARTLGRLTTRHVLSSQVKNYYDDVKCGVELAINIIFSYKRLVQKPSRTFLLIRASERLACFLIIVMRSFFFELVCSFVRWAFFLLKTEWKFLFWKERKKINALINHQNEDTSGLQIYLLTVVR